MWANAGIARRENPVESKAAEPDCRPGAAGISCKDGETIIYPDGMGSCKRTPFKVGSILEAYEKGVRHGREDTEGCHPSPRSIADTYKEGYEAGRQQGRQEACDEITQKISIFGRR